MAIDLKKNQAALTKALDQVQSDKDDTDWALFGYEGQTNVLKVVETGDGGVEEMEDDLSSGKMLYGYCRIQDPNTGLPKYVLIHWTGEGVPENVKLKYTNHLSDVQKFVKSIHVTISARSDEDVNADDIAKRVAKSSGANYGFHKEKAQEKESSPAPVGTKYKRVIPTHDIDINKRDKFWAQAEKEETHRQNEERARTDSQRKVLEDETKQREESDSTEGEVIDTTNVCVEDEKEADSVRETHEREKRISSHMQDVSRQRQAEKKASHQNTEAEKKKWEQVQRESSIDEEERGHRSDQLRRERAAEAVHLASSSSSTARNFFKQKSVERPDAGRREPPPPKKLQHRFGPSAPSTQEDAPRKQPIQLPKQPPAKPARTPDSEVPPAFEPEPIPEPEPVREPEPEPEPVMEPEPEMPTSAPPQPRDLMRQSLPSRQDSDQEDDAQDWDEPPTEEFTFREKRQPSFTEDFSSEQQHAESQSHRISGAQHFVEDDAPPSSEVIQEEVVTSPEEATSPSSDHGLCARALYDYQAADETEITFDPEDIITNIEQIDDGWWQGFAPDGSYGMFPANYVEIME